MDINRKTAYQTLIRLETHDAYSNIELNAQIGKNHPDSPAFVRELVYGVLENKYYLDFYIKQLLKRKNHKLAIEAHVLLRMGLYQLMFMDSVPDYAAVDETIRLAKKYCYYYKALINGILRSYLRKKDELDSPDVETNVERRLSLKYSFAPWITRLWLNQYGEEKTEKLMATSNAIPPLMVRVNLSRTTRKELLEKLSKYEGVSVETTPISDRLLVLKGHELLRLPEYQQGLFSVQDAASVKAMDALAPRPGETIVDVCAAPGGKSLACAEMMQNQGKIYSFDIYENKLHSMEKQAKRLGIDIIETRVNDAIHPQEELFGKADRVICDVPCTGLGVLRRKPEIKYKEVPHLGRDLAAKQLEILTASEQYLKAGGIIMYSTCTINCIENRDVVQEFLRRFPTIELLEHRQLLPDEDKTDGFYYCLMKKKY